MTIWTAVGKARDINRGLGKTKQRVKRAYARQDARLDATGARLEKESRERRQKLAADVAALEAKLKASKP